MRKYEKRQKHMDGTTKEKLLENKEIDIFNLTNDLTQYILSICEVKI